MTKQYCCLTEKGKQSLPSEEEIASLLRIGVKPIIFLDSCVCIDIVKLIDYGKNATNVDKNALLNLKKYTSRKDIELNPMFGLMEVCLKNKVFDADKFWDFKYRLEFFDSVSPKHLNSMSHNFDKEYRLLEEPDKNFIMMFSVVEPFILTSYCALLKIREIALRGLSKNLAYGHIEEFTSWMINDLNIILSIEHMLSVNIFGGITEFRKMIGLDSKGKDAKKKLIGTAWDSFNAKLGTNNMMGSQFLNEKLFPYFFTSDQNLINLLKDINILTIIMSGEQEFPTFVYGSNSDELPPHIEQSFMDNLNRKISLSGISRRINNVNIEFNRDSINQKIQELEIKNNIV